MGGKSRKTGNISKTLIDKIKKGKLPEKKNEDKKPDMDSNKFDLFEENDE